MSKKLLALSLGIIMVLSLMAGCGGNNGGSSTPDTPPADGSSNPAPEGNATPTGGSVRKPTPPGRPWPRSTPRRPALR